ncbi:type VI secretion protein, VC_A0114 family [Burkholderiales bacterium JOSHI_001]|nr:type VI secretion protein, VC_A0114 family [Burkholderiales bacterium JOSHI_001]
MTRNRVIWSEGLFLRPQHFQQLERSTEMLVEARTAGALAHGWGFSRLVIDPEALKIGRIAIKSAHGVMPDGTPFVIPEEYPAPPPLELPNEVRDAIVYLALPSQRAGMPEYALDDGPQAMLVRYIASDAKIDDAVLGMQDSADTKLGRLNLRFLVEGEPREAFCSMGVVRLVEKRSTGQVVLDDSYIAPSLECRAQPALQEFLVEARNLVRHRADALAARLGQSAQKGVGEVQEFLTLQVTNRFDPWLSHLAERITLHPEALYTVLLQLAGEMASFSPNRKRRARDHAPYRHDDLRGSFEPVMADIRELLTEVINPNAVKIPLQERAKGLYTGTVPDLELLRTAMFVLVVNAQMSSETLRQRLPTQLKIGPPDKIKEMVMLQLPGIAPQPLPMAPPRLPYYAGFTYFELDRRSDFWKQLEATRLMALHIAGDFPGLQIEMWALRP